jgi:archaeosine synthase beta-subunit
MFLINSLPLFAKLGGKKFIDSLLNMIKERFYGIDLIYDFEKKQPVIRLTLLLPGKGCSWACSESGGCTMCGFPQKVKNIGKKFTKKNLISLYETAETVTLKSKPAILTIYNAGSFINNNEIPFETQKEICQRVKNHPTIQTLLIESRAEFVTEERIKPLKNALGSKKLIVAIGLEAQDDKIRNEYIHKGLSKETYEKAIKTIKKMGIKSSTYVFIKPIFLSEKEAIEEAVKTAKYAFECGTNEVDFESAFIQPNTLMEKLYKQKKFTPPWLWSIIEVIKRTYNLGNIHIGGFDDEPPPVAIPRNCSNCSERISDILQNYRENHDINLFNNLSCPCEKEWRKIVKS